MKRSSENDWVKYEKNWVDTCINNLRGNGNKLKAKGGLPEYFIVELGL